MWFQGVSSQKTDHSHKHQQSCHCQTAICPTHLLLAVAEHKDFFGFIQQANPVDQLHNLGINQ